MYKIFLQEGKKEDSIKRVKEMFPDDSDFIDKIFDETAKLGAKYIPFVETETKRFLIDPFTDFDYGPNIWAVKYLKKGLTTA